MDPKWNIVQNAAIIIKAKDKKGFQRELAITAAQWSRVSEHSNYLLTKQEMFAGNDYEKNAFPQLGFTT